MKAKFCSVAALAGSLAIVSVPCASATASTVQPNDPSPYCRPLVGTPYGVSGPTPYTTGTYKFTAGGEVHMVCNGPIYAGEIYAVWHASTDPNAIGDGIHTSAGHSCKGSCSLYYSHTRVDLDCDLVYDYSDHLQITGWWRKTSANGKETISMEGSTRHGTSYHPGNAC